MYFWKIKQLKQHLIENGLTEKQLFYYVLIYAGSGAMGIEMMGYIPYAEPDLWSYISSAMNILIPILGTIAAFRANGGSSGVKFAERYFSIGLVVTLRFMVLLIPVACLMAVYWFSTAGLNGDMSETSSPFEIIVISIWYAVLYFNIARHIGNVAKAGSPISAE
jgi:hypothetical protein